MAIFDQIAREVHERMASLTEQVSAAATGKAAAPAGTAHNAGNQDFDPRDTNRDGVVSEAEAAAYVRDYLSSASPEDRDALLHNYVGGLSEEQRREMSDAIVRSPANPIQKVDHNDKANLADAITRTAQAEPQNGKSPLEAAFAEGGALGNPLVKAGLVGLAAAIGSQVLRGPQGRANNHR